ncbi:MAG: extracellular solute-binding protein [Nocardioidaceae bacterium]|nr:extracellular solute-binding protein [Nocardioidaceae bacterium]
MQLSTLKVPGAAAAVLLLAAGCTGTAPSSGGDEDSADSTGSIRYLIEQQEDPGALKLLDAHIDEFEKANPGITVKLEAMPLENMRTVLQTQLRSGEGPDVFNWGSGPGYAGALAEAGLLYDLTDAYEQNDWQIYDFAKERVTFDGKTFGVPGEMETIGLFYNKTLFADLGIAAPESLADLEAVSRSLLDEGIVPIGVSDKEGWQGGHLLSMALSSEVGSDGMDELLNGGAAWDSPDVVSALRLWEDFMDAGYLPESPTALSYDGGNALFYSGEAAMLPTGSWLVPEIEDNVDFEVGYVPFPSGDGPGIFTGGLGSGPFISAGTTETEAALKFVDFLASQEHGQWTVENLGSIPPMPIDTKDLQVSPLFGQVLEDTSELSGGSGDLGYNIDVLVTDVFNEAMFDGVQAILSGQKDAEEVAQDLEAAFRK